jgi:hypothetical protein
MTPGACLHCGSRRRWRLLHRDRTLGCWRCWRCVGPPPEGSRVDVCNAIQGEARVAFDLTAEEVSEQSFARDLALYGVPVAMEERPLPCACRICREAESLGSARPVAAMAVANPGFRPQKRPADAARS